MYICIFLVFRTITHKHTFPHIFIRCTQTNTYILCTNTCTHTQTHIHAIQMGPCRKRIYFRLPHTHLNIHVRKHTHSHTHTHTHTHTLHTCIHTYTHTHTFKCGHENSEFTSKIFVFRIIMFELISFSYFIHNFGNFLNIKTKKNKRNYFNFVLYYQIIRIAYFCVKLEKEPFYCISCKFYTKKIENSNNNKIEKHAYCFMVAMAMVAMATVLPK